MARYLLLLEFLMELKDKLVEILLNQLNFSRSDIDKMKAVLDNINVRKVDDKTFIDIRLNKITIVLESDKNEY